MFAESMHHLVGPRAPSQRSIGTISGGIFRRELLNSYKMVENIDVLESEVPEKLRQGYARFVVRLPRPISTKDGIS